MPPVLYSPSDRIGVITLNRPEARNAVDREMALGLEAAVDRLEDDPEVQRNLIAAAHEHDDTLRQVSKDLLDELLTSADASEGLAAFAEKRVPQWQAR